MKEFTNRITLYIYIAYGNMKKEKNDTPHRTAVSFLFCRFFSSATYPLYQRL